MHKLLIIVFVLLLIPFGCAQKHTAELESQLMQLENRVHRLEAACAIQVERYELMLYNEKSRPENDE